MMLRIASCFQPAICVGASARNGEIRFPAPPALKHQSAAHMRSLQPRPCHGRRYDRVLQGGRKLPETESINAFRCMNIPCKRRKQNAPGCGDPRAFALPREIGVTDLRRWDQSIKRKLLRMHAFNARARQRIAIFARWQSGIGEVIRHDISVSLFADTGEGREHYASNIINASEFLMIRNNSYNHPFCRANRYASIRLAAPNLPIASER
jgi:hypothetical protein